MQDAVIESLFEYDTISISENGGNIDKTFLKFRLFPTKTLETKFKFSNESQVVCDTFYDFLPACSDTGLHKAFEVSKSHAFYRERSYYGSSHQTNKKLVHQTTDPNVTSNSHYYVEHEVPYNAIEGMEVILKYNFKRRVACKDWLNELEFPLCDVVMDEVLVGECKSIPYRVISDRKLLAKSVNDKEFMSEVRHAVGTLFRCFFGESFGRLREDWTEMTLRYPIYPVHSKFMYLIRFTEHYRA